ncbi:TetR/AcrR family transcriptional regulator [Paenibacillus sp.]|uniref:TetR/AcrR family transcriptional regulator n=1 Tax=Paenibacillus sp. TaxID=58172 RepID=UPI002D2C8FCB|nr:TetR/AcrR family transcriptional regulator [Paenibacillus sp.]HZG57156.1 TetR/AcrR family transcriptional regulator [Paenibacillus sp.]
MEKKTRILNSALTLFAAKGYHQTTIQDIADEAGIAKGGIDFYFKSKEELLLSVVTDYYKPRPKEPRRPPGRRRTS